MLILLRLSNSSKTPEENTQVSYIEHGPAYEILDLGGLKFGSIHANPDATLRPHPSSDRIHTPSITAEILPLLDPVSFYSTGLLLRGFG